MLFWLYLCKVPQLYKTEGRYQNIGSNTEVIVCFDTKFKNCLNVAYNYNAFVQQNIPLCKT